MEPALDLEDLRDRVGGDEELLVELMDDFIHRGVGISELLVAAETQAFAEVSKRAHRLKGSLLALGAKPAGKAASNVELQASTLAAASSPPDPAAIAALAVAVAELSVRFDEARRAMETVLAGASAMAPASSSL